MNRLLEIIYSVAITIMFGTALCADGLAEVPGGFPIMFILIGIAGALVYIGNRLEDGKWHFPSIITGKHPIYKPKKLDKKEGTK